MELSWIRVDGEIGGNQEEFPDFWMRLGGCAAICAADSALYFGTHFCHRELYSGDGLLSTTEYQQFCMEMKPYLHPRFRGIDKLSLYTEGFSTYLRHKGAEGIAMRELPGDTPYEEAAAQVVRSLSARLPVPCLTLRHKDLVFDDLTWHWYSLIGYENTEDGLTVKTVTCGDTYLLPFARLWDTGYREKGGLILYDLK